MKKQPTVSAAQFQALAEFRYQIRRFLHFSENAAREGGLEPQQHQVLLALKGFAGSGEGPTMGYVAERLQIRPHTAVELVNRMEEGGLVRREPGEHDRRQAIVRLTREGESILAHLSAGHLTEISQTGPALVRTLESLLTVMETAR